MAAKASPIGDYTTVVSIENLSTMLDTKVMNGVNEICL